MKRPSALAAKLLRQELKKEFPLVKFSVTSETYSGGSSIRVKMTDQPVTIKDRVTQIANKYQYGHFDGMYDIYEYSNVKDHAQAKYVFVDNEMSDSLKQEIWTKLRNKWTGADLLPESYDKACALRLESAHEWVSTMVWREFNKREA